VTKKLFDVLGKYHQQIVVDMIANFTNPELIVLHEDDLTWPMRGAVARYKEKLIGYNKSKGMLLWNKVDAAHMIIELTDFALEFKYQFSDDAWSTAKQWAGLDDEWQ